ncbi:hypothetical protein EDB87DRAFT_1123092 [Lactarius vividus]|nr:hypothetical protein EDB87DRAFT_1123092 [Lactarius vividus]
MGDNEHSKIVLLWLAQNWLRRPGDRRGGERCPCPTPHEISAIGRNQCVLSHAPWRIWSFTSTSTLLALHFHWHKDHNLSNRRLEEALSKRPTKVLDRSRCELSQLPDSGRPGYGNPQVFYVTCQTLTFKYTVLYFQIRVCPLYSSPRHAVAAVAIVIQTTHGKGCIITSSRIAFNPRDSRNNPQAPNSFATAPRSSNNPPSFTIS